MDHIRIKLIYQGKLSPAFLEAYRHDELYQELLEKYPECPFDLDDPTQEEAERLHCGSDKEMPCQSRIETDVDDVQDELKCMDVNATRFDILNFFWNEDISSNGLGIDDLAAEYILYREKVGSDEINGR